MRVDYLIDRLSQDFPMPDRYFEDFEAGQVWTYSAWTLEEDSLVAFAEQYDPQPMHTDPGSDAARPYGGVIASGWQTALGCITPFLDDVMKITAGLASPGFDVFEWLQPVRAGEPIKPRTEILETRRSKSKPDLGIVKLEFTGTNADGMVVWRAIGSFFIRARPASG